MMNIIYKITEQILWMFCIPAFMTLGLEKVLLGTFIYPIRFMENIQQYKDIDEKGIKNVPEKELLEFLVSFIISMIPEYVIIGFIIWLMIIL